MTPEEALDRHCAMAMGAERAVGIETTACPILILAAYGKVPLAAYDGHRNRKMQDGAHRMREAARLTLEAIRAQFMTGV